MTGKAGMDPAVEARDEKTAAAPGGERCRQPGRVAMIITDKAKISAHNGHVILEIIGIRVFSLAPLRDVV